MRWWRRVPLKTWAWVHFKFMLGVAYPLVAFLTTLHGPSTLIQPVYLTVLTVTFIGAVLSIVGLLMGPQPGGPGLTGPAVELSGLIMLATAPAALTVINLVGVFSDDLPGTLTGAVLCWALTAAMIARLTVVIPLYRLTRKPGG